MRRKIFLVMLLITLYGCHSFNKNEEIDKLESVLSSCIKDDSLPVYSYLIAVDGQEKDTYSTNNGNYEYLLEEVKQTFLLLEYLYYLEDKKFIDLNESIASHLPLFEDSLLKIKDLIEVPSSQTSITDDNYKVLIKKLLSNNSLSLDSHLFEKFCAERYEVERNSSTSNKELFNTLISITKNTAQKEHINYNLDITNVKDAYPCWYVQDKRLWAGWNIFVWNNQVILWKSFKKDNISLLMIKFMEKKVFVAVTHSYDALEDPSVGQDNDLLKSPLARKLISAIYMPDIQSLNDASDIKSVNCFLGSVAQEMGMSFAAKELQYLYQQSSKENAYISERDIMALYNTTFPNTSAFQYKNDSVLASINYIQDNSEITCQFSIDKDTLVDLIAQGQMMRVSREWKKWNADMVELFFYNELIHPNGTKYPNSKVVSSYFNDTTTFRRYNAKDIKVASHNIGGANYQIEVKIPWTNWEMKAAIEGIRIPTEVKISDFDIGRDTEHGFVRWLTPESAEKGVVYNEIKLVNKSNSISKSNSYQSIYLENKVTVDGKKEMYWDRCQEGNIDHCFDGEIIGKYDLKATFRCGWNKEALFFFFDISDDVNVSTDTLGLVDYCWIRDLGTGEGVWELPKVYNKSKFPVVDVKETIKLKKGEYELRYKSNALFSFQNFLGENPPIEDYGVKLYFHNEIVNK